MKTIAKTIMLSSLLLSALSLFGCQGGSSDTGMVLRVYNCEDYISEDPKLTDMFEKYVKETDGVDIKVVYNTYDTNETMLSQLQTGASNYDLICPSDYMIQKMAAMGLLTPFFSGVERENLYVHGTNGWDDNYEDYCSSYLKDQFQKIKLTIDGSEYPVADYARGYMWGTLGLIYNPSFFLNGEDSASEEGIANKENEVKVDMYDWNSLWKDKYNRSFQIKDSVRDTFAVGLMHGYDNEFSSLLASYKDGSLSASDYNFKLNKLFNNIIDPLYPETGDEGQVKAAREEISNHMEQVLLALKDNSYGLEVDSGKQDIVTGKTGIGIAWSGDAVWSMDLADNEENKTLYYSLPETGANIWFDGWVMPKHEGLNQEYAQKFIDFISDPVNVGLNMSAIGYTSFIAGDAVLDLVRSWYDPRMYALYKSFECVNEVDHQNYWEEEDFLYDDEENYILQDGQGDETVDMVMSDGKSVPVVIHNGDKNLLGSNFDQLIEDGTAVSWDEYQIKNSLEWSKRDLTYFFEGTLSEYNDKVDAIFYSDEIETLQKEDGTDFEVGRQFLAQYPSGDMLPRLAVMADYGEANSYVLRMWESVKSGKIELWVVVVFSVELILGLGVGVYFLLKKAEKTKLRKKRREDKKA